MVCVECHDEQALQLQAVDVCPQCLENNYQELDVIIGEEA